MECLLLSRAGTHEFLWAPPMHNQIACDGGWLALIVRDIFHSKSLHTFVSVGLGEAGPQQKHSLDE